MKTFIVTESTNEEYVREFFEIDTKIKQNVVLPFTDMEYRCVMFNGVEVQLTNGEEQIIGSLM
jgi:hypothetical protein